MAQNQHCIFSRSVIEMGRMPQANLLINFINIPTTVYKVQGAYSAVDDCKSVWNEYLKLILIHVSLECLQVEQNGPQDRSMVPFFSTIVFSCNNKYIEHHLLNRFLRSFQARVFSPFIGNITSSKMFLSATAYSYHKLYIKNSVLFSEQWHFHFGFLFFQS